jgi:uncharacterized protein with HEPN domain
MTGKDRIILQKTINYARDAIQYISGMDFEQFMNDRKTILLIELRIYLIVDNQNCQS